MENICISIPSCTNIAFFNNTGDAPSINQTGINLTAKGYTIFSTNARSINPTFLIGQGNHTWVYTTAANSIWQLDMLSNITGSRSAGPSLNIQNETNRSMLVINQSAWNILSMLSTQNITAPFFTQNGSITVGFAGVSKRNTTIQFAAWWNNSKQAYVVCAFNFTRCAGTSETPGNITIPPVFPVWVATESNFSINVTQFPFDAPRYNGFQLTG
jgi:hypothetical protein